MTPLFAERRLVEFRCCPELFAIDRPYMMDSQFEKLSKEAGTQIAEPCGVSDCAGESLPLSVGKKLKVNLNL